MAGQEQLPELSTLKEEFAKRDIGIDLTDRFTNLDGALVTFGETSIVSVREGIDPTMMRRILRRSLELHDDKVEATTLFYRTPEGTTDLEEDIIPSIPADEFFRRYFNS